MNLVRKLSGKLAALVGKMSAVDIKRKVGRLCIWLWVSGGLMVVRDRRLGGGKYYIGCIITENMWKC